MKQEVIYFSSPIGCLKICLQNNELYFIKKSLIKKQASFKISPCAQKIKTQLKEYFNSQRNSFSIPLAQRGTSFQRQVWKQLQTIPYGQTQTYKEISLKLGDKNKARPVGQACSQNPFLIIIPCHRVLSQKNLGGFALGLKAKRKLLNLESKN